METSVTLIAIIGTLVSLIASLLTNLIASKAFIRKSKIKIGGVDIQLSESADESTKMILDRVQELKESPRVFLSYSSQDKEFAKRLATDLRELGVEIWLADEQIKVGDRITDSIRQGISSSQWAIVLLSENSLKSDFTSKELLLAFNEEHKRKRPFILPALIGHTELPADLQDKQYADFRGSYNLGFQKLLARVKPGAQSIDQKQSEIDKIAALLTPGDREILELMLEDITVKEIGERLGLSPGTVAAHKARIYEKLRKVTQTEFDITAEPAKAGKASEE